MFRFSIALVILALIVAFTGTGCSNGNGRSPVRGIDDSLNLVVERERLLPVLSSGAGLFAVLGQTRESRGELEPRREHFGYGAELMILSQPGRAPFSQITVVSEERRCIASTGQRVVLWMERIGSEERLTETVEAIELRGCDEIIYGEWLIAISGNHDEAQWDRALQVESFQGGLEAEDIRRSLRGEKANSAIEEEPHFSRFELAGTELTALVMDTAPVTNFRNRGCHRPSVVLLHNDQILASFDAGDHLGVLSLGDRRFVVTLASHRSQIRVWTVEDNGVELVTEAIRPSYSDSADC